MVDDKHLNHASYASSDEEDIDDEEMQQPLTKEEDEEAVLLSNLDVIEISAMTRRTILFCVLILIGGLGAAGLFFWYGYSESVEDADDHFDRRSSELVRLMESKWIDYELTALATHEFCQRENATHVEFTEFYEYVLAAELDVQSLQCARNVTNDERPAIEAESEKYLKETYDYDGYKGFVGLVFDEAGIQAVPNKTQEPYYYIITRMEPFIGNEIAMNLDLKDDELEGRIKLESSWETKKPVLTNRLTTIQETDAAAYAVIIYHPGIPLSTDVPGEYQRATWTSLLVRIPSLLDRVGFLQEENLAIFMYNILDNGGREFLGAASFTIEEKGQPAAVEYIDEIEFEDLIDDHDSDRRLIKRVSIASGSWDVVVVPIDNTYDPSFQFIIFGSCMIFLIGVGVSFWMYSNMRRTVEIYKAKAQAEAERTIVTNLFPETVRERLVEGAKAKNEIIRRRARRRKKNGNLGVSEHLTSEALFGSKPIADFYPAVTILCADLAGFTAWSSQREPSQVFSLLEVIYHDFDEVAKRRGIFKVETVGDAYVAAAGVPNYRDDHAVVIARFAENMLDHLRLIVNQLETTLGPDTGDLDIRIGIHSGPVTAGVLRGDKGRFQLFGDTMNMASRMESTAGAGNIQITAETAALLKAAGKEHWIEPREGKVMVKGKGNLSTFWLKKRSKGGSHVSSGGSLGSLDAQEWFPKEENAEKAKVERLVTWNVEQMCILVREIVARRDAKKAAQAAAARARVPSLKPRKMSLDTASDNTETDVKDDDSATPLEQVKDVIYLPQFDEAAFRTEVDASEVHIPSKVVRQLREFVTGIGSMYRANPFHNFEHASHVAMSVTKLLSRIVNPRQHNIEASKTSPSAVSDVAASIHDHTFGITSDPLTHFAAFFSALIHDVDHPGVPNPVLMEEMPMMAENYKHKSVAEQNSVDLAWLLLMGDEYKEMCEFIFENVEEMKRFRQLVINMVMATDVMDKELGALRKDRWKKAFDEEYREFKSEDEDKNRKATIVIEHLIQASDVSHTMQHWHVYIRWNENLFMELYDAYRKGRIENDPSEGWYKGEIGFMDFYVIPLAKKLKDCGVFGVSSDEFLNNALSNRREWEERGQEVVAEMMERINREEQEFEAAASDAKPSTSKVAFQEEEPTA
mmetsp:Transcript_17324/g.37811  ORF Transcript_17324/g.37811 Transcript_17324/m.37811 type:complete len:1145 (-) Transcript_17324:167-3601(-)